MDVLIDLIIWIIKALANAGEARQQKLRPVPPPTRKQVRAPQPIARAAPTNRVTSARPRAQATPAATRGQPMRPPTAVRRDKPAAVAVAPSLPARPARAKIPVDARSLRIPIVLSEVLGPPAALREPEF